MDPQYKPLDDWLDKVGALLLRSVGSDELDISIYSIKGRTILVQRFIKNNGWEIYRPVCDSNEVAATLQAASEWIEGEALDPLPNVSGVEMLRYLMTENNLGIHQLSMQTGISVENLTDSLDHGCSIPSYAREALAVRFGVSPDLFL